MIELSFDDTDRSLCASYIHAHLRKFNESELLDSE